ncbi:MAG: ABC transporter permease, partial [Bryobacteraceae bacterium]
MPARLVISLAWLTALHIAVIGAGFFAPYDDAKQNRTMPFAPPTRVYFVDEQGEWYWRPFVCLWAPRPDGLTGYVEDCSRRFPLRFFVSGARHSFAGVLESQRHLFGIEKPAVIYLMGTDKYGRDQFSRFLHGGQVSLLAGVLACAVSLSVSLLLGIMAGFYGNWIDEVIMSLSELFLGLPWLYLLFAVRAFLPLHMDPSAAFLLVVTLIGLLGWARPARLIRGVVLSGR